MTKLRKSDLPADWHPLLGDLFNQTYIKKIEHLLNTEETQGATVYPDLKHIFHAFHLTSPNQLRVIILGQDPYHGAGQAHGLSFSVPKGVTYPPSLKNIFKELVSDVGCSYPATGDLSSWAKQGVLLLNSVLSVRANYAGSHQGQGWELFTDEVISRLNAHFENRAFVLWGAYAQKKGHFIDGNRHLILQAPHPSPLSAHRGFFGSKPFSKINSYLKQNKLESIQWQSLCDDTLQ